MLFDQSQLNSSFASLIEIDCFDLDLMAPACTARSLKADVILCSTCLSACSAAQRWEHALQIFKSLQDE